MVLKALGDRGIDTTEGHLHKGCAGPKVTKKVLKKALKIENQLKKVLKNENQLKKVLKKELKKVTLKK